MKKDTTLKPKTYVVIPQFLVTQELVVLAGNAIESYRKSSDVFIISVDDLGEYEKALGADDVLAKSDLVLTNKKNSGFGITCNNGFKWIFDNVKEDCYIVCSNNDIEVYPGWLEAMQQPFEDYDNVAVTGILHSRIKEWDRTHIKDRSESKITEGGLNGDRMQDGGLWMSKKSVLQKVGIFDEQFLRGGYEDVDLFLRMRDTFGMKIIMSARAYYWHKEGATRWNSEQVGAVNNFGAESKDIEHDNLRKFINKWGFNPHARQIWFSNEIVS